MKFTPIKAVKIEAKFGKPSPSLKKKYVNITNTPVLITGTIIEARIEPTKSFFYLNKLETKPANKPAIEVFNKQVKTVATGEIAIKTETVFGERRMTTPLTKPKKPATRGP